MEPSDLIRGNIRVDWAISYLADHGVRRDARGAWRPDGLLERALLAYPDAFGEKLALPLSQARECVLRDGDARSRERLESSPPRGEASREIERIQRILNGRPSATERTAPALVMWSEGLTIALAHPVPHANSSLAVRVQIGLHPEVVSMGAQRIEASKEVLDRWKAIGYPRPPHSVWRCDPPSWVFVRHGFVVEVNPNPRGFNEAMLIAHLGAGRLLVPHVDRHASDEEARAMPASVMPSGWSYLLGDRTMGSSHPVLPSGAPHPSDCVHVPDDDLFALCASLTWTASLRDAIWIRSRRDYRMLG